MADDLKIKCIINLKHRGNKTGLIHYSNAKMFTSV